MTVTPDIVAPLPSIVPVTVRSPPARSSVIFRSSVTFKSTALTVVS